MALVLPDYLPEHYFLDNALTVPPDSKGKEIPGSKGAEGREFVNLLFKLEDEMKDLTYEEKKKKRQEASKAILDAFWSWVNDGRLPISNNLCEANIRPFATAKRAWLFADTPKGAVDECKLIKKYKKCLKQLFILLIFMLP